MALDRDKRPLAVMSSNPGHLLFTHTIQDQRARHVVTKLTGTWSLLRLGHPHPLRGRADLQPDELPSRFCLAA